MTRTTNARIAGLTYLFYTAIAICADLLMHHAVGADGDAAAVALYGITREQDHELAVLALVCRVAEGVLGALGIPGYLQLLWLAKAGVGTDVPDIPTKNALLAFLLMPGPSVPISAIFFAVGSTIFSYLLLRGRMVPVSIAWLGVFASGLLVVGLPLQLAGFNTGPLTGYYQWLPALVFQIVLALWLLIKGVAAPATR